MSTPLSYSANPLVPEVERRLSSLWSALEHWDSALALHSEQTSLLALQIAMVRGEDLTFKKVVTWAARLHDIGKVALPSALLDKNGPLDERERRIIQTHPTYSYAILHRVEIPAEFLQIVLLHHERYDGKGYPIGLKGEDIPLAARIVAVADAYSALTSQRPYRDAYPPEQARALMKKNAGRAFDPSIIESLGSITKGAHETRAHV